MNDYYYLVGDENEMEGPYNIDDIRAFYNKQDPSFSQEKVVIDADTGYKYTIGEIINVQSISSNTIDINAQDGETVTYNWNPQIDINAQDEEGLTALMRAVYKGNMDEVVDLIAEGADLDIQDRFGRTALMWAAISGNANGAEILINAGANDNAQDQMGKTAFMWAIEKGHADCVTLLQREGNEADILPSNDVQKQKKKGSSGCAWLIPIVIYVIVHAIRQCANNS